MSLEDDIRRGVEEGLENHRRDQEMKARWAREDAANREQVSIMDAALSRGEQRARELLQNGDYFEAISTALNVWLTATTSVKSYSGKKIYPNRESRGSSWEIMTEAMWKWGNACEQGSEKYPKDEAKALDLWKRAACWRNKDAQQTLKQRGLKVPGEDEGMGYLLGIAAGLGLAILVSKLLNIDFFLLRWLVNIAVFVVGFFITTILFMDSANYDFHRNFSVESLRLTPPPAKKKGFGVKLFLAVWLAAALAGWAGFGLGIAGIDIYDAIRNVVQASTPIATPLAIAADVDVPSENGAAKIFRIDYAENETVISIIRTSGSHKAVSIAEQGKPNSFYVKDGVSGKTYPLRETRLQDYADAAGVELVFDPFKTRAFDLIEGSDTSASAWHFRNIRIGD
jgi:hypothetical protein